MNQQLIINRRTASSAWILDLQGDLTKVEEESVLQLISWEQGLPEQKKVLILKKK